MALILCLEAGTDVGSVALARDGELISLLESGQSRQHAQNLALYIEEMLRTHDLEIGDLDAVAIGKGPGSYTGLRICTALAKGICYGAKIPLIAIGSLEALCRVALEEHEVGLWEPRALEGCLLVPMIDARRMEVYCQQFDHHACAISPVEAHILTPESFQQERQQGPLLLFGDGASKCADLFVEPNVYIHELAPSARGLIIPAEGAFHAGRFEEIAYFEPFYLKDFLITPSTKKMF